VQVKCKNKIVFSSQPGVRAGFSLLGWTVNGSAESSYGDWPASTISAAVTQSMGGVQISVNHIFGSDGIENKRTLTLPSSACQVQLNIPVWGSGATAKIDGSAMTSTQRSVTGKTIAFTTGDGVRFSVQLNGLPAGAQGGFVRMTPQSRNSGVVSAVQVQFSAANKAVFGETLTVS
jgi:hypothetical protein